jgi:hypothetical protein
MASSSPPVSLVISLETVIPGYEPADEFCTLYETSTPFWLYTNILGAGGRSGISTPSTIPLRMGLSLVRSSSIPKQAVSSDIPLLPIGRIPLAFSSRTPSDHSSAVPCRTATSDAIPDVKKPRCFVRSPQFFSAA